MSFDWANIYALAEIALFFAILLGVAWPLGDYVANVFAGKRTALTPIFLPLEKLIFKLCRIYPEDGMHWQRYAQSVLAFSVAGVLFLYALLRLQDVLPMNPAGLPAVNPHLAFNIAVSFVTNTNWQSYSGEQTLSLFSQMVGLTVQNFLSAATGLCVLVAMVRGFMLRNAESLGNFWVDLVRGVLYVLLPLTLLLSVALQAQGVPESFDARVEATTLEGKKQILAMGPVASQVAIKQIGSNGGGFFNANAAHPYENPTPFSNFISAVAVLLLPIALCLTFGSMVNDRRQGWAVLAAMLLFLPLATVIMGVEQKGNPHFDVLGIDQSVSDVQSGGNMEGKETRFGAMRSGLWATATTASANGSTNASHAAFLPISGAVPLALMQMGEVVFGGIGSGLYGMLAFVLLAVFVAGLMVGRTPEYLGKKVQAFEIKMVSIIILIPPFLVLCLTAIALSTEAGRAGILNPGASGFTEVIYAFTSAANNNGSSFASLNANTPFYNTLLGIAMLAGRFGVILPVLAIAGSLARKNIVPVSAGTLPTHGPLFVIMLAAFIVVIGLLTFMPALALGPAAAQLQLMQGL